MMKHIIWLILLAFMLHPSAFAFSNEPNGFRGLKWGISIEEFKQAYPNATYRPPRDIDFAFPPVPTTYLVPANNSKLSGISIIKPLEYSFYNNQLEYVRIILSGEDNFTNHHNQILLLDKMTYMYDEPTCILDKIDDFGPGDLTGHCCMYEWKGIITGITMIGTYNDPKHDEAHLSITIYSKEIRDKRLAEQERLKISEYHSGW